MRPEQFTFFAGLIEQETGIVYSQQNAFQLENRLETIAAQLSVSGVDGLFALAKAGVQGEFRRLLIDSATNNETLFFRDPKVFDALQKQVLPELVRVSAGRETRIWSAACSFGQEPYSVALILAEMFRSSAPPFSIWATDIAQKVLQKAKLGSFTKLEIERGLSPELRDRHFLKANDDLWTLRPELRSLVRFDMLNLLQPMQVPGPFDLVLCRNVLIYQRVENKSKIVRELGRNIRPGGYLILGAGESLIGVSDEFEQVTVEGVFIYRRR